MALAGHALGQDSTTVKPLPRHRPFPPRPARRAPFQGDGQVVKPHHNFREITEERRPDYRTGFLLGTDALSLMEPDGGPSIAVEYRPVKFFSAGLTTTFLRYDLTKAGDDLDGPSNISGIRLTPDIKFFLPGKRDAYHLFFGLEGLYKQVKYWGHIGELDEKYPDGSFVPAGNYRRSKYIWGLSPTFGMQRYLDKHQRFQFEFLVGLGFRHRYENWHGVGTPGNNRERGSGDVHYLNPDIGWNVHFPVSVRFAYRL